MLGNHFHLLVRIRTRDETFQVSKNLEGLRNPTQQFSNLFNAYAKAINKAYNRTGGLFQERFGRILITTDEYFCPLDSLYPFQSAKAGLVSDFGDYPWSSYDTLASTNPTNLKRDDVLSWFNGREGFIKSHAYVVNEKGIAKLIEDDVDD